APKDGWFWYSVQIIDVDQRAYPARLDQLQVMMKVCVDTRPPAVSLRQLPSRGDGVSLEGVVRDENLGLKTLVLEFRADRGQWQMVNCEKVESGQATWNPNGPGPFEVRMQVRDKAGNLGEDVRTVYLGAGRNVNDSTEPSGGGGGGGNL